MSMKALEWAMYDVPSEMTKGSLLRILLALADHADTEGNGAFPSQKRLCALTGYSRRTIQHGLHDLEASGLIVKGDQRLTEHYGRHRPIVWNLTMEDFRGVKTAPLKKNESEAQHATPQISQEAQLGAQKTAVRGAIRGAIPLRPNLYKEESYIEPRESNARARKQIPIPADWKPTEEHQALADRLGIDCDVEAGKFKDRALDTGATSADWDAKFRIWLMRGHELGYTTVKNQQSARKYTWASDEVKRVIGTDLEGTDDYMALACKVANLLNQGVDPDMLRRQLANVPDNAWVEQLFEQEAAA